MIVLDLWRVLVAAAALWMGFLVTRLAIRRWRDLRAGAIDERTHPLVYASYALALYAVAVYRMVAIGTPLDSRLVVSTLIVATGFIGLMIRFRLNFAPPWRRHSGTRRRAQR